MRIRYISANVAALSCAHTDDDPPPTGSPAASIQSLFYKGSTSGLFSKLQSLGAVGVKGAALVGAALCPPYAAWCVYKALYSDGDNPELWQALEECACAGACDCDDDCACACKRRRRGLWSRIKAFFCSSTFITAAVPSVRMASSSCLRASISRDFRLCGAMYQLILNRTGQKARTSRSTICL